MKTKQSKSNPDKQEYDYDKTERIAITLFILIPFVIGAIGAGVVIWIYTLMK